MSERRDHWQRVWTERDVTEVSWYQREPGISLELVRGVTGPADAVVDIGGGVSALVLHLALAGYLDLTVVDLSTAALDRLAAALVSADGALARVALIATDVLTWTPGRTFRCWHDRAAFHFLTDERDRRAYVALAAAAVEPGGHVVLATFAADGPEQCSGLPVHRTDAAALAAQFAPAFELVAETDEHHVTPWQADQHFQYTVLRRR